jgi:hypothetical protein
VREWQQRIAHQIVRLRSGGRAALLWSSRVTIAATASYIVATLFFPGTQPLLAPLTAMLVVQVTPVSLLTAGLDRVLAVVSGVSLAVVVSTLVPLEWWSLGLLIFVAITIGQTIRLRANLVEVAISGMLVLGVGSLGAESAAWQRVAETLVGAAVGIAANLLFPPKVATSDAGQAIDGLADSVSELLNRAADELTDLVAGEHQVAPAARAWLGEARQITHNIPRVGAALLHAEQGRRFNVRAVGTADVGPGLRQGLEALEHSAIAIRSMFRVVVDATGDPAWPHDEDAEQVLLDLAQTFRQMAAGVDAFGHLVRDEAEPVNTLSTADVRAVQQALEGLHEARTRLDRSLAAGGPAGLLELHAALLSTVKRLLGEMDLDERIRRQVQLMRTQRPRSARGARASGRQRPPAPPASPEPTPEAETQVLPPQPPPPRDRGDRGRG